MEEQAKVYCQCAEGRCFLEEDTAWSERNSVVSAGKHGFRQDTILLNNLEVERLRQKDEWMDALGVQGTRQVCCRQQAEKAT